MTERIDHTAKAREALAELDVTDLNATNLPADWCGASDDEQWLVHATLEEAQVHATLALVEQQRIANLLALAQFRWTDGASQTHFFTALEAAKSLRFEAAEALGLEP